MMHQKPPPFPFVVQKFLKEKILFAILKNVKCTYLESPLTVNTVDYLKQRASRLESIVAIAIMHLGLNTFYTTKTILIQ